MTRPIVWWPWEDTYRRLADDDYEYEVCDICECRYSRYDGRHGIEECMRSLAKRVKLLWEQNQEQGKEIAKLRKELGND